MAIKVTRKIVLNVLLIIAVVAAAFSLLWTNEVPMSNIGMSMTGHLEYLKAS